MNTIKTTIAIFAIVLISILASCSKDETNVEPAQVVGKYRLKKDGNNYTYDYNSAGKISTVTIQDGITKIEYKYNSQNVLTQIRGLYSPGSNNYIQDFSYNSNGKISEKLIRAPSTTPNVEYKEKQVYEYDNNNNLKTLSCYPWDIATDNYFTTPNTVLKFVFNSNGKLIRHEGFGGPPAYLEFIYDAAGNMIEEKEFKLKSGSTTIYYLAISKGYTYDDKIYYRKNLIPVTVERDYSQFGILDGQCEHNPVDISEKRYSESGLTSSSSYTYQYEYNDGGYPIKQTSGSTVYKFTYEKIN